MADATLHKSEPRYLALGIVLAASLLALVASRSSLWRATPTEDTNDEAPVNLIATLFSRPGGGTSQISSPALVNSPVPLPTNPPIIPVEDLPADRIRANALPPGARLEIKWTERGCFHLQEAVVIIDRTTSTTLTVQHTIGHQLRNRTMQTPVKVTKEFLPSAEELQRIDEAFDLIRRNAVPGWCTNHVTLELIAHPAEEGGTPKTEILFDDSCSVLGDFEDRYLW